MIIFDSCREDGITGSHRPPVSCVLMTDVWWPRHAWCSGAGAATDWGTQSACDSRSIMYEQCVTELWPDFETLYDNILVSGSILSLRTHSRAQYAVVYPLRFTAVHCFQRLSNLFKLTRWVLERWTVPSHFLIMWVCVYVFTAFCFLRYGLRLVRKSLGHYGC